MKLQILIPLLCLFLCRSFAQQFKYDLDKPIIRQELPKILDEISGLTDLSSTRVACVQDELGTAFIYDFKTSEIVSRHKFDSIGDFEGLTFANNSLFILRSDGRLTEWPNFPEGKNPVIHYKLDLDTANNEGLCYDEKNNRLLIAAKGKPQNHDKKSERFIYAFDLTAKKLGDKLAYTIDVEQLALNAQKFNVPAQAINSKGNLKPLNFRPSSIAIHPKTNEIYLLSAEDALLIVINRKSEILQMQKLDMKMFPKAEGLTFLSDGTMIITNEAAGNTATLLVFEMKR